MNKKFLLYNICLIIVLIISVCIVIFYPNKAYLTCDKSENICTFKRVSAANKEYVKTAKLSSLSSAQYSSMVGRQRHDDLMYIIDYDKEKGDNIFAQFSFSSLDKAKSAGANFDNYVNSDYGYFNYEDKNSPKTYRNILIFLGFVFAVCLGALCFDMSEKSSTRQG